MSERILFGFRFYSIHLPKLKFWFTLSGYSGIYNFYMSASARSSDGARAPSTVFVLSNTHRYTRLLRALTNINHDANPIAIRHALTYAHGYLCSLNGRLLADLSMWYPWLRSKAKYTATRISIRTFAFPVKLTLSRFAHGLILTA